MTDYQSNEEAEREFELGKSDLEHDDTLAALPHLERALKLRDNPGWHSYLGYCIARERGQLRRGEELCRESLADEPDNPAHFFNLARVHLAGGDRVKAMQLLREGMASGGSPEIVRMLESLGQRSPLLFPFLSRRNPLNRYIGLLLNRLGMRQSGRR